MKISTSKLNGSLLLMVIFSVLLLTYVSIRAYSLSFTHDESLSFTISEGRIGHILTANNHVLNTILMFVSKTLFGNSEFALRLPNVLSAAIYLSGCFLIFRLTKNSWLFLFGISLSVLNPFLIEFFSLARGYGLSLAFMLMSIFFVIKQETPYRKYLPFKKDFLFSVFFASLAAGANLIMINFLISILLIFALKYWRFRKENDEELKFDKNFFQLLLLSCIPLLLGIIHLLILKTRNQLYHGADSFIEGITSLITMSIYYPGYSSGVITTIKISILSFLLIGTFLIVKKKKLDGAFFYITTLMMLLITGLIAEYFLFGAKFPHGRTALFCVPITALFIHYLLFELIEEFNIKKWIYIPIILCLIAPLYLNFITSINFKYTKTWRYDANTKETMKILKEYTENNNQNLSISNHWLFEPAINYYIDTWKLNLNSTNRDGVNLNTDFIYQYGGKTKLENFQILNSYKDTRSTLLMKTKTDE